MSDNKSVAVSTMSEMRALVDQSRSKLAEVAPKWLSVERLTRLALAACSRQPALLECTKESFLLFCMRCSETGLEPTGAGGAWPVPFRNKYTHKREVTFVPDWRGLIQLAKKTGQIKHAYGEVVHANDMIDYEKGDSPRLTHKPALSNRGEIIGVYCVCVLPDDAKHIEFMGKEEIEAIQNRSKAKDEGPWVTDWAQMAIKTVVKRALKVFACSPEMQTAIEYDNAAIGLSIPEERPSIAKTRIIETESTETTTSATQAEPRQEQAAASSDGDGTHDGTEVLEGILEAVAAIPHAAKGKEGESGYKRAYTIYNITIDGEKFSTFDGKLADAAGKLIKQAVLATTKKEGKYTNIVDIRPANPPVDSGETKGDEYDDNVPLGDEPKITPESVEAMEKKLSPQTVTKAKKMLGITKDMLLTDLDQEILENLRRLYLAAK